MSAAPCPECGNEASECICVRAAASVRLDSTALDWLPDCYECGCIVKWEDAVALPASALEGDEPTCLIVVHADCPVEPPVHLVTL